jgi:eukaryotic-like serine/threonine-protein kinase
MTAGMRLGRYVVEGVLGKGAMGTVYRATDTMLRRVVALKVVEPSRDEAAPLDPSEAIARFLREARAAASLQHPNVVAVFDVGEDAGRVYLAMELVEGTTLREKLTEASSLAARVRWLVDVARGLSAAHVLGLVHRDVKPENVLVDAKGTAKLADFGIVKRKDAGPSSFRTGTGEIFGTPDYMAPEQWATADVDAKADQYAWGIMAYEVLSRRALPTTRPPPLESIAPEVPAAVAACIAKASAHSADDRHASMEAIIAFLEPYCATAERETATVEDFGGPKEPTPRTAPNESRAPLPSRARVFAMALGVTMALAGVAAAIAVARWRDASSPVVSFGEASAPSPSVSSSIPSAEEPPSPSASASSEEATLDAANSRRPSKPPPKVNGEPRVVVRLDTASCKGVLLAGTAKNEADKGVQLMFQSHKVVKCFQSRITEGDMTMYYPVIASFSALPGKTSMTTSSGPPRVMRCLEEVAKRSDNAALRLCEGAPLEVALKFELRCKCSIASNREGQAFCHEVYCE